MTATTISEAMRRADINYWRFDRDRDNRERNQRITRMAGEGFTDEEIAVALRISSRHVKRIRNGYQTTLPTIAVTRPDLSEQRCADLEDAADTALTLACRLRDDDPQIIWDTLTALTRGQLQELAVVMLAAIPIDRTKSELFGWVTDLAPTTEVA